MEDTQAPNDTEDIEIDIGPLHVAPISTQMVDVTFVPAPRPTRDAEASPKSPVGPIVADLMPRDSKGHWLPGSRPANLITSETARDMLDKRGDMYAQRKLARQAGASRGVIAAASQLVDRPIVSDEEAHEVLAETLVLAGAQVAREKGQLREAVAGIGYGLRLAGQAPAEEREATVVVPVQINIGPELVRAYGDEE